MDYAGNQVIQLDGTTGAVISSVNLQIPSNMGFNELECFINGKHSSASSDHTESTPTQKRRHCPVNP